MGFSGISYVWSHCSHNGIGLCFQIRPMPWSSLFKCYHVPPPGIGIEPHSKDSFLSLCLAYNHIWVMVHVFMCSPVDTSFSMFPTHVYFSPSPFRTFHYVSIIQKRKIKGLSKLNSQGRLI